MKNKIMNIIQESPNLKFKSKDIAKILNISITESSKYLVMLCNSCEIESAQEKKFKVFYIPVPKEKTSTTQSRVVPEFKQMTGYTARMSERLERKDFHLITLDKH